MSDSELLEAAAKAAGINGSYFSTFAGDQAPLSDGQGPWNPLTDDGDALRLAVALRMRVEPWGAGAAAVVSIDNRAICAEPHYGDDPCRATRRAIVRAAAAMASSEQ